MISSMSRKLAQRSLCKPPAWVALAVAMALSPHFASAIAVIDNLELSQLTWMDRDGTSVLESNSSWGYLTFAYTPDAVSTSYLNISLALPGGAPVWVAQNVPLFRDDVSGRLGIDVDLSLIGINPGTKLTSADLVFSVDPAIRAADPLGLATRIGANELKWFGWEDDPVPGQPSAFPGAGNPQGTRNTAAATAVGMDRDIRSQQEGSLECFLGATTRSLDWLGRTNPGLGLKDAAGIYGDLKTLVAGQGEEKKIELKAKYAGEKSISTKLHDTAGFFPSGITGVAVTAPSTQSLDAWLMEQFATEDIELAVYNGNWAHIVTVTRVYKTDDGKIKVRFRDDEDQGPNSTGDTEPKEQELYLKDGVWRLGSDTRKVYYGMAESVPEPGTLLTVAFAMAAALYGSRKRAWTLLPPAQKIDRR